nr:cytochrome c oxidase assembly protein [Acidimicrobiia bacterium]
MSPVFAVAAPDVWRVQLHPEVWLLVGSLVGLYVWAAKVVGPKVVATGRRPLNRRNVAAFVAAVTTLWVASDWPMHDIGEQYLYLVHMVQHTLLTLVVPPLALLATPRWLADLVLGHAAVRRFIRRMARPVVAGLVFNAMAMAIHWPALVNASVGNGALHYVVHVALVFSAFMMWTPVCGPIEEWRMTPPAQMIYLFLMSIIPTVPGAWLTFADRAVYSAYDIPARAFGITVRSDQQAAGVFMKLVAGGQLWAIITVMFFVWAFRNEKADRSGQADLPNDGEVLTFDAVRH